MPDYFDWGEHFRRMNHPQFGTIAGRWTIAELRELIANKQYVMDTLEKTFKNYMSSYPGDFGDWESDWQALKDRWNSALTYANIRLAAAKIVPLPDNDIPAQDAYESLLKAIQQKYPEHTTTKGDLDDLNNRLMAMGAKVDLSKAPQPKAADADIRMMQATLPIEKIVDTLPIEEIVDTPLRIFESPYTKYIIIGAAVIAAKLFLKL